MIAPVLVADARIDQPKISLPAIAKFGQVQIGYSTQEDVARKWGEGKEQIGGHPNSGRIWRVEGTDWLAQTDGFEYSKRGLVIDQLSLSKSEGATKTRDIPATKSPMKNFLLLGEISLGLKEAKVLEILERKSITARQTQKGWEISARGYSPLTSIRNPIQNWKATLTFTNDSLVRIELSASPD